MKTSTVHKILIVDDDLNDTYLMKRALLKSGFALKVDAVLRGKFALELMEKADDLPSLIFLDLKMPGLSGLETLRLIRADGRLKDITVIIFTTSLLEADKKESYAAGADDFLRKAFDIDQFGRDIKSALELWLT